MEDRRVRPGRATPVACNLTGAEQSRRREKLARGLFSGCELSGELEDGYEFVFPGEESRVRRLVDFVLFERECCPFLSFSLDFEPDLGPVSLRVRGPEGTKEFIAQTFTGDRGR